MITIAGVDRGLSVEAICSMEIGQVVDFVEEYNRMHKEETEGATDGASHKPVRREATQADWDAFWHR